MSANELWNAYRRWCHAHGLRKIKPLHQLVKDIASLLPGIQWTRGDRDLERSRLFYGLRVRPDVSFDVTVSEDAPRMY